MSDPIAPTPAPTAAPAPTATPAPIQTRITTPIQTAIPTQTRITTPTQIPTQTSTQIPTQTRARAAEAPDPAPVGTSFPGKTLGIIALVVAIFFNIIGFILGLIARNQSKSAGYKNGPATAAIVIGIAIFAVSVIVGILVGASIAGACTSGAASCTSNVSGY
ncbi:MAG: hypothetical protein JWQ47_2896 [Glaciihabitans sp.]|nr:hypothetical protein [Glaciihabitans sp.]